MLALPRGTPLEETARAASSLDSVLRADRAVRAVFGRVGRSGAVVGIEQQESGLNSALLEVRLDQDESTERALRRLRPRLTGWRAEELSLETGQATALGRLLGGGEADLAVRIRGEDLKGALAYGREVRARLRSVPAVTNVRLGTETGQPELRVEIDRERAAAFGIEPRRIAEALERYMRGRIATELVQFDEKIPVIVALSEEARRSAETLNQLTVEGVPLRELIHTREAVGPVEVRRSGQRRTVPVYADIASGGLEDAVSAVREALAALPPPRGVSVEIGGENEEMRRALRGLAFAFALALLLVYMILAAEFESFIHPFTILLSVPLALIGAVLSLWIAGVGINAMSLIGLVILVGIVDNDAIVKVDFINRMRREGLGVREAILAAGQARLRPILMTTVTTLLGVAPMALGLGRGAELRQALAVVVFGGLLSATLLTLIVIPVAYSLVEDTRGALSGFLSPRRRRVGAGKAN
jgi:HAE1 family hydrophobic/amphiphilic exporter-1